MSRYKLNIEISLIEASLGELKIFNVDDFIEAWDKVFPDGPGDAFAAALGYKSTYHIVSEITEDDARFLKLLATSNHPHVLMAIRKARQ